VKEKRTVVVTGLALTSALGSTALATWQNIKAGKSAIALRQPFLDLAPMPLAMVGKQTVELRSLTAQLAQQAWLDADLDLPPAIDSDQDWPPQNWPSQNCGIVIGSSRSHLQSLEAMAAHQRQFPGQIGPPTDAAKDRWLAALPHQLALTAATVLRSHGPLLAPMAACATGIWAISQAADLIRSGQCDRAIAGAIDAPITPLTLIGFRKMGALATTGCYPFDIAREGFVLGEGGALLVLESAQAAAARGAKKVYGEILAAGITNDSHHVSAFDPSYAMGKRAVEQCLQRSGLSPQAIDAVHVHGTSTAQNDRMEASLVEQMLGRQVPIMASKGATGHTLGAAGAIAITLSLLSLQQQTLLPCVGLQTAAFDLNFVRQAQAAPLKQILCFSFGFGGQNAVLALSRPRIHPT
jgi:3-oxoacyl-[acyl-carrier-protein] synthase II